MRHDRPTQHAVMVKMIIVLTRYLFASSDQIVGSIIVFGFQVESLMSGAYRAAECSHCLKTIASFASSSPHRGHIFLFCFRFLNDKVSK